MADTLADRLEARDNTEVRRITVPDAPDNGGTRAMSALAQAMAEEPRGRIAGAILLSDGRVHDMESAPDMPAPLHLLHSGRDGDWDRRLKIDNAPAFAILDEEVRLTLRIDDDGAAPEGVSEVPLDISIDGADPRRFTVPLGEDITLPVTLPHAGRNVLQFTTPDGRRANSPTATTRRWCRSTACATGSACFWSRASRIPAPAHGATC